MGNSKDNGKQATHTEIVFILDASGSMSDFTADTIGGFNGMIDANREEPGEAVVSTIIFNDGSHVLHNRLDIREVPRLSSGAYRCCGCTALLDAVGGAIHHQETVQEVLPGPYKADKVLFVITTDGMENASTRYTYAQVKRMIERHREEGWEFLFIGANIDAAAEAAHLGIAETRAASYVQDARGTEVLFEAVGDAVRGIRCAGAAEALSDTWRQALDEDVRSRDRGGARRVQR